jgi:ABC-type polysaccharide/polyol phosphate transport system ATPase subunit
VGKTTLSASVNGQPFAPETYSAAESYACDREAPASLGPRPLHFRYTGLSVSNVTPVEFRAVSKSYAIYDSPGDRLTELLSLNRAKRHRDFLALEDVSFAVERGQTFCIVGQNGSGKSTLLQIVAGILQPSAGSVAVNGRVAALLELGAAFNPEFTGRDNVYLSGSIMGLSTRQIGERYAEIESFAEIGAFIDQPVKTYSSGMAVRLAFAVAIHADPEILLVDEALAVGDLYFRQRCMRRIHELRLRGVTILFVSHAAAEVKAIADCVLWLDHGRVAGLGDPDRVVGRYLAAMAEKDSRYQSRRAGSVRPSAAQAAADAVEVVDSIPNIDRRHGDGRAEVLGIGVFDEQGQPLHLLEPLARIQVRISVRAKDAVACPIAGFLLRNQLGMDFSETDTAREGCAIGPMQAGDVCTAVFHIDLPELYPASFSFSPFVADGSVADRVVCDWIDNAVALQMARSEGQVYGYVHLPCRVEVHAPASAGETP